MKVFNYISAFLLAGAAIVVSCSQNEEMEGMESSQNFQINVFDGGYQNIQPNLRMEMQSVYLR